MKCFPTVFYFLPFFSHNSMLLAFFNYTVFISIQIYIQQIFYFPLLFGKNYVFSARKIKKSYKQFQTNNERRWWKLQENIATLFEGKYCLNGGTFFSFHSFRMKWLFSAKIVDFLFVKKAKLYFYYEHTLINYQNKM